MTDVDLFGHTEPVRKGGTGYLERLADLSYPDGYTFWCLAGGTRPRHLPFETTEIVWLTRADHHWMKAVIDITDGTVLHRLDSHPKMTAPP